MRGEDDRSISQQDASHLMVWDELDAGSPTLRTAEGRTHVTRLQAMPPLAGQAALDQTRGIQVGMYRRMRTTACREVHKGPHAQRDVHKRSHVQRDVQPRGA